MHCLLLQHMCILVCVCRTGHAAFAQVERKLWMVNDTVAGFKRHHANLTELVVRNAGHMVPHDKPLESQIMIEDWIFGVLNPS